MEKQINFRDFTALYELNNFTSHLTKESIINIETVDRGGNNYYTYYRLWYWE